LPFTKGTNYKAFKNILNTTSLAKNKIGYNLFALVRNLVSHIPRVELAASLVESNRARLTKMPQSETNLFLIEFMYILLTLQGLSEQRYQARLNSTAFDSISAGLSENNTLEQDI